MINCEKGLFFLSSLLAVYHLEVYLDSMKSCNKKLDFWTAVKVDFFLGNVAQVKSFISNKLKYIDTQNSPISI
jgi:hypothetical protein